MRLTPDKKLHSREHALADDLATMMGEQKKFAAYLGIARRWPESDLRALARRVSDKEDLPAQSRGKYFFACLRGLAQIPTKKKPRRKNGVRARSRKRNRGRMSVAQEVL